MPDGIVTSSNDMLSGIDSTFFDGADADPQEAASSDAGGGGDEPTVEAGTGLEEIPAVDEPAQEGTEEAVEEPVEGAQPADTAPKPTTQPVADAPKLPDGVRAVKNSAGKEGYWVEPTAWKDIQGSYDLVQQASSLLHTPLTLEAIELRDRAYQGQERMYTDFLSGDPASQKRFIDDWILTSKDAMQTGQIGGDPFIPFVGQLLEALEKGSPEAYDTLRMADAERLVNELYDEAATQNNQNLYHAVGHIAAAMGLKYKPSAEMQQFFTAKAKPVDEVSRLRQENETLRSQMNGTQTQNAQAELQGWRSKQATTINSAIKTDAVGSALSTSLDAWKKIPGGEAAFNDLVIDRLHTQVTDAIRADKPFMDQINVLDRQVMSAKSPQVREKIGEQILQRFIDKAKLIVRAKRGEFETFAANAFKEKSDQTHARRGTAQSQRVPKGGSAPVPTSLIPNRGQSKEGTMFNAKDAAKEAAALIAAM